MGQWGHRILLLASEAQGLPAGRQHTEVRTGGEQGSHTGRRLQHMLEVVEQEEHGTVGDVLGQAALGPEHASRRLHHQDGISQRRQRDPPDPVGVAVRGRTRSLKREAGLPGPTRPGQSEEAGPAFQQAPRFGQLPFPPQERGHRDGQVRLMQAFERREFGVAELVDTLGCGEVLQAVLAEVA